METNSTKREKPDCCFFGFLDGACFLRWEMSVIWHFVLDNYSKVGFKHLGLILLLIAYSGFGGWLFREIEGIPDMHMKMEKFRNDSYEAKSRIITRMELLERLKEIDDDPILNYGTKLVYRKEALLWYEEKIGFELKEPELEQTPWTWWGSIFYAGTLYTTIGYGNFGPATTAGRVATMIYALCGIPLTVTILNDWGNLMFRLMCYLWNGGAKLLRKWLFKVAFFRKHCRACFPSVVKDATDEEDNIALTNIPLSVALFVLVSFVCGSAGIYCIWEDWDYFTSFYFFFISFTTIGLGDVTPEKVEFCVASFVLILMGLSVVAMSLNIIQAKVDSLFNDLIASIDSEFKTSLEDPERGMGDDADPIAGGIEGLQKKQGFTQRFLFQLMGDHSKHLLQQKWEDRAKLRNRAIQTTIEYSDVEVQTEDDEETLSDTSSMDETKNPYRNIEPDIITIGGPTTTVAKKGMYIYDKDGIVPDEYFGTM